MVLERPFARMNTSLVLAAHLAPGVAAACLCFGLCGMAWAGSWTHDSTNGAATVVALPAGQATLAHDGADRQARTITYVETNGATTTIARDYGPSGHKAIEVNNGVVSHHVYGAGLAPLLRVEGDGSLTYQAGMDTISADGTGGATVAHLVTDARRSTVAVLDAQGQPRQQVAYGTLGQSTSKQDSASVYAKAARSRGYEGLATLQPDGINQLIDNRARVYFPSAGRFLALDAAGDALGYEARGNNWIMFADHDGNMRELINALREDPGIVLALGEDHNAEETIYLAEVLSVFLGSHGIPHMFFSEANLLFDRDGVPSPRVSDRFADRLRELGNAGLVYSLESGEAPELFAGEEQFIRAQLLRQGRERNKPLWSAIANSGDYTCIYGRCSTWNLENIMRIAARKKATAILFMGAGHLAYQKRFEDNRAFYRHPVNGRVYLFTLHLKAKVISLHPLEAYDLVNRHILLAIAPYLDSAGKLIFDRFREPYYSTDLILRKQSQEQQFSQDVEYQVFTSRTALDMHPSLKRLFFDSNEQEEEKSRENAAPSQAPDLHPVVQPDVQPVVQPVVQPIIPNRGALEVMDAAVEEAERGRKSCCNCCLVQ